MVCLVLLPVPGWVTLHVEGKPLTKLWCALPLKADHVQVVIKLLDPGTRVGIGSYTCFSKLETLVTEGTRLGLS